MYDEEQKNVLECIGTSSKNEKVRKIHDRKPWFTHAHPSLLHVQACVQLTYTHTQTQTHTHKIMNVCAHMNTEGGTEAVCVDNVGNLFCHKEKPQT